MKRLVAALATAALAAAVSPPARAEDCEKAVVYGYCGEHWRRGRLPVRLRYDNGGMPTGIGLSSTGVQGALRAAIAQWESYWQVAGNGSTQSCQGTGPWRALCFAGTTGAGYAHDGVNTVTWGDLSDPSEACPGGGAGAVAIACSWFEGSSGAAAKRLDEVDIVLNNTNFCGDTQNPPRCWKLVPPEPDDLVFGELEGLAAGYPVFCDSPCERWFDVQSAFAHEIGHVLGLTDIGSTEASGAFPGDLTDAPRYTQTMYRWYYRRSTNKRSLEFGDIAGIARVQLDSAQDP